MRRPAVAASRRPGPGLGQRACRRHPRFLGDRQLESPVAALTQVWIGPWRRGGVSRGIPELTIGIVRVNVMRCRGGTRPGIGVDRW